MRGGASAGPDPWRGDSLEWLAPSPPPPHNFDVIPDVRSDEPMRDIRDAVGAAGAGARASRGRAGRERRAGSLTRHGRPPRRRRRRDQLRRFRRLADLTVLATFALIVLGGIVRVSESGLGCGPGGSGTEGWPLCNGAAVPFFNNTEVIVEFSHRALAAIVTALIALLAWTAYRHRTCASCAGRCGPRSRPGVLVLVQAGLGGLTVEKSLAEELVAAHLGLAMILIGLLLWIALRARAEIAAAAGTDGSSPPNRAP